MTDRVAIGLRAKTGRAIAVVIGGTRQSPIVLSKSEIKLTDPKIRATAQPHHVVMDLPWEQAQRKVKPYANAIERAATKALGKLISAQLENGKTVVALGVVGAPDRDLARIGNPHIRAHAAEGVLFRRVIELGAESNGLAWQRFSDRDFDQAVAPLLGRKDAGIRQIISDLRRSVPAPWRTEEKQAAMAAWLVLHG